MLVTLLIGYSTTSIIGIVGFLLLGGPIWAWGLLVWLGGAIACLLVAAYRASVPQHPHTRPGLPTAVNVDVKG